MAPNKTYKALAKGAKKTASQPEHSHSTFYTQRALYLTFDQDRMKTLKTGLSKCETSDDRCRTLNPEPLSTGLSLAADLFLRSFPEVGFENMLVFWHKSLCLHKCSYRNTPQRCFHVVRDCIGDVPHLRLLSMVIVNRGSS